MVVVVVVAICKEKQADSACAVRRFYNDIIAAGIGIDDAAVVIACKRYCRTFHLHPAIVAWEHLNMDRRC